MLREYYPARTEAVERLHDRDAVVMLNRAAKPAMALA